MWLLTSKALNIRHESYLSATGLEEIGKVKTTYTSNECPHKAPNNSPIFATQNEPQKTHQKAPKNAPHNTQDTLKEKIFWM